MDFMESSMACFTAAASKLRLLIAATFFSKGRLPMQSRMPAAAFMARCPVKLTAACAVVPTHHSQIAPQSCFLWNETCTEVLSDHYLARLIIG